MRPDHQHLKGFEVGIWHAFYAPKGTPKPVIDKLVSALQAVLKDEIDKWGPLVKKAGIYAD